MIRKSKLLSFIGTALCTMSILTTIAFATENNTISSEVISNNPTKTYDARAGDMIDVTVSESITLKGNRNSNELTGQTYSVTNNSELNTIEISNLAYTAANGYTLVNSNTDFSKLSVSAKQMAITVDGKDIKTGIPAKTVNPKVKATYNVAGKSNTIVNPVNLVQSGTLTCTIKRTTNKYKVEHYQMNLDGKGYTLKESSVQSLAIGSNLNNLIKTYEGFTYEKTQIGGANATIVPSSDKEPIKIYYTRNKYTVTYNANGGTGSNKVDNVIYGQTYSVQGNSYTRTDYTFAGWNTRADGKGTAWSGSKTWTETSSITLYAQWKVNPYSEKGGPVPAGATYTTAAGQTYNAGQAMPEVVANGDKFTMGDYVYVYDDKGWNIYTAKKSKTEYGVLCGKINGEPVTSMTDTFINCRNLTKAPEIPSSVTVMKETFSNCTSLTKAPEIPSSVTVMEATFSNCTSLTKAPEIPSSVTVMRATFNNCTSLTTAPEIPSSVTDMIQTFKNCRNLTKAPAIPQSVIVMAETFFNCTSLTTAPEIPSSVTVMKATFMNCTNLKGDVIINARNVTNTGSCFDNCAKDSAHAITLKGTCPQLAELKLTGWNEGQFIKVQPTSSLMMLESIEEIPAEQTVDKLTESFEEQTEPTLSNGDTHETADYIYTYNTSFDGWSVKVKDITRTEYEPILDNIKGKDVVSLDQTFKGCDKLEIAPKIPKTVIYMNETFMGCKSLKDELTVDSKELLEYKDCFKDCATDMEHVITLKGNCKQLDKLKLTGYNNGEFINIFDLQQIDKNNIKNECTNDENIENNIAEETYDSIKNTNNTECDKVIKNNDIIEEPKLSEEAKESFIPEEVIEEQTPNESEPQTEDETIDKSHNDIDETQSIMPLISMSGLQEDNHEEQIVIDY